MGFRLRLLHARRRRSRTRPSRLLAFNPWLDLMATQTRPKVALTVYQRTILRYYYHHKQKYPQVPCYAPKISSCGSRRDVYFKALETLERLQYITVDRRASNYTGWIIKDHPNAVIPNKSSAFT